jgi:phosphoribosylformimino-5-aminoimidazole carboxamide ribotide isomerase
MILYPAIDLKDGSCVRLLRGDMNAATVFSTSPAAQALSFEKAGFSWLHLVDLDGACAGESRNGQSVCAILTALNIPVQLGGGIRSMAHIEHWLEAGISRVILGTVAAKNPALVKEACKAYPEKIAVGIDARAGMVAVEGWGETSELSAIDLAKQFEDAGVAAIIYTDIDRDGAMQGANVAETAALARAISTPVILSGGVTTVADLARIREEHDSGIHGAIIGRALYEGTIMAEEALRYEHIT